MRALVVIGQQVIPEIAALAPPDRVNVVGVVLNIIVFEDEIGALQPVVVRLPPIDASHPGETQVVHVDGLQIRLRNFGAIRADHLVEQTLHHLALFRAKICDRNAFGLQGLFPGLPVIAGSTEIGGKNFQGRLV